MYHMNIRPFNKASLIIYNLIKVPNNLTSRKLINETRKRKNPRKNGKRHFKRGNR